MEFDTGLVVHHILLGTGFSAAEQHRVCAAHILHLFANVAVQPPEQQNHRQQRNGQVQQAVPDGGALVDGAELDPGILQPGYKVVILRDGVGFVRVILVIHKEDLLIFDLYGRQLLVLQHLQESAVVHAFDLGLHHGWEQEQIAGKQDCNDNAVTDPKFLFGILWRCGFFHGDSSFSCTSYSMDHNFERRMNGL